MDQNEQKKSKDIKINWSELLKRGKMKKNIKINKNYIISSLLIISAIFVMITGIILYIAPSKELAFLNHWKFAGIGRGLYVDAHVLFGFITIILLGYLLAKEPQMFWNNPEEKANQTKKGKNEKNA